ncbi:MAG: GNAT family N-acetyltransferase, partial [bacterium]
MKEEFADGEVSIRELREEDYRALVALWREGGLPYRPQGRDGREALARQLKEDTAVYLVAEAGGTFVGAVLGSHDGRKGWINRLVVHPDYSRRSVGAMLVADVERRLAAGGFGIFACLVVDWNEGSLIFFENFGYKLFHGVSYFS